MRKESKWHVTKNHIYTKGGNNRGTEEQIKYDTEKKEQICRKM